MESRQVFCFAIISTCLFSNAVAEFFDLSNGNSAGLIFPCGATGAPGFWKFEEASKYPGGPTEGTVFTSDPTKGSCVLVQNLVTLSQDTKFNFKAFVPYTSSLEVMYVWLVTEDQFANYEWVKITGPITAGSEWIERSISLPAGIKNGNYYVEVWDTSTRHAISLRYFDITDQAITTAPVTDPSTSTVTTTETPEATTEITTVTTEITTDSTITSTEITTESTISSTETTEMSTESTIPSTESTESTEMSTESTITSTESTETTEMSTESTIPSTESTETSTESTITSTESTETTEMSTDAITESSDSSISTEITTETPEITTESTETESTETEITTKFIEQTTELSTSSVFSTEISESTSKLTTEYTTSLTTESTTIPPNNDPTPNPPTYLRNSWWWIFLIGIAVGVIFATIMFGCVTWCWWLACVRWRSRSPRSVSSTNGLPRLEVVSSSNSGVSITAKSSELPSYRESWTSNSNWNLRNNNY